MEYIQTHVSTRNVLHSVSVTKKEASTLEWWIG